MKEWEEKINSGRLPDLAHVCNKFLLPTIMCPWGGSVFLHKVGSLPIDIVFQRYLEHCDIDLIDKVPYRCIFKFQNRNCKL